MSDASKRAEIGLCLMLAAADGVVSDAEVQALSSRLGRLLGEQVGAERLEDVVSAELEALDDLGPDGYITTLVERLPPASRLSALRAALSVACADGLAPEEEAAFREAAAALSVDELEVDAMLDRLTLTLRPPGR
jgi:uncharacterized tellurite resistance protein B-like protein